MVPVNSCAKEPKYLQVQAVREYGSDQGLDQHPGQHGRYIADLGHLDNVRAVDQDGKICLNILMTWLAYSDRP